MSNILIYFPYNLRTVEQQSVMELLVKRGHTVVLLTTCQRGYLHQYVESIGVLTEWIDEKETKGKLSFFRSNLKKLKTVLDRYKIDVVIAHQQNTALIAGLLRQIKRFPLVYFRHNSDEDYRLNYAKAKWYNKLVNALTPVKVAPSSVVEAFWIQKEGVSPKQIKRINYGYNFSQYEQPVLSKAEEIRKEFSTSLLILSIARLVDCKRHALMFATLKRLVENGVDCKLVCLGSGPLQKELQEKIDLQGMAGKIFLLGRKENVFDYIEACDVFMHFSSTEASNSAVKEVGLRKKPVLVCKGVGDFGDYIVHNCNGFLLQKEQPEEEAFHILLSMVKQEINKAEIGEKLFETVTTSFDIDKVAVKYEKLLNQLVKS
jgi:glycosyltransferase involved in cell wall biosynthesis